MESAQVEPVSLPASPGETLLALHRAWPGRYPVLLESAASGTPQGRFSLLLARPRERLEAGDPRPGEVHRRDFLERLDSAWRREAIPRTPSAWPFTGGWFLFLGYELAGEIEPTLRLPPAPAGERSLAWRMRAAVVHDHLLGVTVAAAEPAEADFARQVRADLALLPAGSAPGEAGIAAAEEDPQRFLGAVRKALARIAAGDIYQANLSRAWRATMPPGLSAADLYGRLRRSNPAPFAGIADLASGVVVSSSPERLVRVCGRRIEARPIAGTRPRLGASDSRSIGELIGHPKERAEHIMLIDLERNDLGRLCEPGTVAVDEMMSVESYAHVHHIVSNIGGQLRRDVTPAAVLKAMFPGGTITGCPKVRCMQLIGEFEGEGRGAYTGSMGYLGRDGDLDLNILIRTLTVHGNRATLRAGAGIVADSEPERELEETRAKARGVLRALQGEP
jgi:anthranilate synthase component 1